MAAIIYRGSTCRIKFKPLMGVTVEELGEPTIAIYQDNLFITPEEVLVDTANNCIYADLTQDDTLMLGDGLETTAQAAYVKQDGSVVRFPVHTIDVRRTLMWTLEIEEETQEEPQE